MNCELNCILDFFDGVMDFTKLHDSFKRVCENLDSFDIKWNSLYGRNFVQKFAEAKHELTKRCPVHGYEEDETDETDDEDMDEEVSDNSEEESEMDEEEEEEESEEEENLQLGQCCCESIFQPMESFYLNKSFKKLVQIEEDDWVESNPKFDNALSNLTTIQPLIKNVKRNGIKNLSSLDIRLILNLIENFEYYTCKTEEVLENYFKYSYDKLTNSIVSLNDKRNIMAKPHLEKKILRFLYIMEDWLNPNFNTKENMPQNQKGSGNIAQTLHGQVLDSTLNMTKDAMIGNDLRSSEFD